MEGVPTGGTNSFSYSRKFPNVTELKYSLLLWCVWEREGKLSQEFDRKAAEEETLERRRHSGKIISRLS